MQSFVNTIQKVSILVLLDHARGVFSSARVPCSQSCFNPCSVGSCSGSVPIFATPVEYLAVSILVLLDHARGGP